VSALAEIVRNRNQRLVPFTHTTLGGQLTMVMTWCNRLAPLLSTMSLAWCVLIGVWFWFTPIEYEAITNDVPTMRHRSFSEVSRFGPAPLIVPVLITAAAAWAAWRGHQLVLGVAAFVLAGFTFISGFSIGGGYLPASGLLLAAVLASSFSSGQRKSAAD
jgi:hypothetical protein